MPSYQIEFVGGDERSQLNFACVDDHQALRCAGLQALWRSISVARFPMMGGRSVG